MQADPEHELERFVTAQEGVWEVALRELRAGQKRTHWMWFIFPQLAGRGFSEMAVRYAIRSRHEAERYLGHAVLGPRLVTCAQALLPHQNRSAREVMGSPDDLKLRSSMTLFAAVSSPGSVFQEVLDCYYSGQPDPRTLQLLRQQEAG